MRRKLGGKEPERGRSGARGRWRRFVLHPRDKERLRACPFRLNRENVRGGGEPC